MQYIRNDGHITSTYNVQIDTNELARIIKELDEKCYHVVKQKMDVQAQNKKNAQDIVLAMADIKKTKIYGSIEVREAYYNLVDYRDFHTFECYYIASQSSQLSNILKTLLFNYESNIDYKKQNNHMLDLLGAYEHSDELKSYDDRIAECIKKSMILFNDYDFDANELKVLQEEFKTLLTDKTNNSEFDFALLRELYNEAMNCFKMILVDERIHYKDILQNESDLSKRK